MARKVSGLSRNVPHAPVVRRVDSAIHWINHYPLDSVLLIVFIRRIVICPVDSVIHLLNNRGRILLRILLLVFICWIVICPVDSVIHLLNSRGQDIQLYVYHRGKSTTPGTSYPALNVKGTCNCGFLLHPTDLQYFF